MTGKPFPLAMDPPKSAVTIIGADLFSTAVGMSRKSPRGRIIFPFHKSLDDPLQRMLNVLQPYSYIRPHRHDSPPKAESIVVLKGSICFVTFSDDGDVLDKFVIKAGTNKIGVDAAAHLFHTFFALEEDTILFEVKPGPYNAGTDKDFASWAPEEGTPTSAGYLSELYEQLIYGKKTLIKEEKK
jgi:cupin fold WbuC family metalloprotein